MKKVFLIGWKDLTLAFRDRAAVIFMLAAPFALTVGLGLVTGRFSSTSSNSGVSDIPILVVNQDSGLLGQTLVEVLQSDELADLLEPSLSNDLAAARSAVDEDETAAVLLIPPGFSDSLLAPGGQAAATEPVRLELYTNPTRPTSVGRRGVPSTYLRETSFAITSWRVLFVPRPSSSMRWISLLWV